MGVVVTTGCPYSGWETVVRVMRHLGLDEPSAEFVDWSKEAYAEAGVADLLDVDRPIQPGHYPVPGGQAAGEPECPVLWSDDRSLWMLDFLASAYPSARFLLFYTRAETALANALSRGIDPERFIAYWQRANREILRFQRRNRHRSLLFNAEVASRYPEKMAEVCRRIGLTIPASNVRPMLASEALLYERLLARQLLAGRDEIELLEQEFDASAYPLGEAMSEWEQQPLELYEEYRQRQLRIERIQADREVQAALAADRQRELNEAVTRLTEERDNQAAVASELKARLEQVSSAHEGAKDKSEELAQENELLLLQLHQVQEELESTFLEKQALEHAKQQLEAQQHQVQEQVKQLTESHDKLAAVSVEQKNRLEKVLRAQEETERKAKDLQQENELLLLQLHQVQEELEHYFLQYQELAQKQNAAEEAPQSQEADAATTSHEPQKRRALFGELRAKRTLRKREQQHIRQIKESGLFDTQWYLAAYPDVAEAGADPIAHYLRYGAAEGRDPSPNFNTTFYLQKNPDVAEAKMNPLIHYIRFGREEGRSAVRTGFAA